MESRTNATSLKNVEERADREPGEHYRKSLVDNKDWKPKYERMLVMRLQGYDNETIADCFGVTTVRVSQVLNSPMALKGMKELKSRLRESAFSQIEDELLDMGQKAVENLRQTIESDLRDEYGDVNPGSKAKRHQDDVSFKVLETLGYGKGSAEQKTGKEVSMPKEVGDRLVAAIENSDRATELHEDNDGVFRADDEDEEEEAA